MKIILTLAGAFLVLLDVLGGVSRRTRPYLPLGGSHLAQIAIVFGLAFVLCELVSVLS